MDRSDHVTNYILFLLLFGVAIHVAGVQLSMSAQRVLPEPGTVTLTCLVDETDVDSVLFMHMKMYIGQKLTQLGLLRRGKNITAIIPTGYADRMTVSGFIDQTATDSRIMLTIDQEKIQCKDGTIYQCQLTYLTNDVQHPNSLTTIQNGTLEVYEYPSIMSLEGILNGIVVEGPTVINKAQFQVGDQLELTCTANVGSIQTTVIQWRRTSEIGQVDTFIEYNPPFGTSSETDPVKTGCAYTRAATIRYNMTMADASRQNNLVFECYVRLTTPPYNNYETTDNKRFYAEVWAPAAPYDIQIDSIQQTSVTLSWQPGFYGGFDQTVVIQISTDGIFWINKTALSLGQNIQRTTVTLQDLYSSRSYFLRMFSYTIRGKSNLTQIFHFTTLGKEENGVSSSNSLIGGVIGGVAGAVFIAAIILIIVYLKRREFDRKDNKELEGMTESSPQYESQEGRPQRNQVAEFSSLSEDDKNLEDMSGRSPEYESLKGKPKGNQVAEYSSLSEDNKKLEEMTESSPQYESLEGQPQRNQVVEYSSLSEDNKELEDMSGRSPEYESLKGRPKGNQVAEYSSLSEAVQLKESPANYYNLPDRKPYQNLQTSQT